MDFETMTVDELDAYSVGLKREIEAIRDKRREAKAVRDRKVVLESLARKLGVDVSGITPEQARNLLAIAIGAPKPGDVVVTPAHVTLDTKTGAVEVTND